MKQKVTPVLSPFQYKLQTTPVHKTSIHALQITLFQVVTIPVEVIVSRIGSPTT